MVNATRKKAPILTLLLYNENKMGFIHSLLHFYAIAKQLKYAINTRIKTFSFPQVEEKVKGQQKCLHCVVSNFLIYYILSLYFSGYTRLTF